MQLHEIKDAVTLKFPAISRSLLLASALCACDSGANTIEPRTLSVAEITNETREHLTQLLDSIEYESTRGFEGLSSFLAERNRQMLERFSRENNPAPSDPKSSLSEIRFLLAQINQVDPGSNSYARVTSGIDFRAVFSSYVQNLCRNKPEYQSLSTELVDVIETIYSNGIQRRLFEARLASNPYLATLYRRYTEGEISAEQTRVTQAVLDAISLFPNDGQHCYCAAVTFGGVATAEERASVILAALTPRDSELGVLIRKRENSTLDDSEAKALDHWLSTPLAFRAFEGR